MLWMMPIGENLLEVASQAVQQSTPGRLNESFDELPNVKNSYASRGA